MKEKTPLSHEVVCFQMLDFETSNSKSEVSKSNSWKITSFSKTTSLQREPFLTMFYIITPLTNILPFHWFRARHMICLSFARRRPCDSASVCRALVRRLAHGVQYPDVRCVYEDDKLIVCNHFGLHDTTCSTVKVFAICIRVVRGL